MFQIHSKTSSTISPLPPSWLSLTQKGLLWSRWIPRIWRWEIISLRGEEKKLHHRAFLSTPGERNYDVGDRELLAVKLSLEEWRQWLEGVQHPFLVLTDHRNSEFIQQAKWLNARQAQWSLFFNWFQFTLSYRLGSKNLKPDTLSRVYLPTNCELLPFLNYLDLQLLHHFVLTPWNIWSFSLEFLYGLFWNYFLD